MVRKDNLRPPTRPTAVAVAAPSGWGANPLQAFWRLSVGRLAMYLEQLGELLEAGVTMHEAMGQLALYAHDGRLRRMSREIAVGASAGESLQAQLARYPQLVPPHVRGMLIVGERAGSVPRVCRELAAELREQQAMRWKTSIGQLFFGVVFGLALLVAGSPRLISLTATAETPVWQRPDWAAYGHYLNTVVWPVVLGFVILWNGGKLLGAIPALAAPVQRFLLWVPGARQLISRSAMIRFLVSLDALLTAGVDIQEALSLSAEATGNVVIARQLETAAQRIREGANIQQALAGAKNIPQEIVDSLSLAEHAGTYQRTLGALAQGYRQNRSRAILLVGMGGYGAMMLLSIPVVVYVLYIGYNGYFNALFTFFDEH